MQESAEQVINKPSCYSTKPARNEEDCQECHFIIECHSEFNRVLFYGE